VSPDGNKRWMPVFGIRTLTCALLLAGAAAGLVLLEAQVPVWNLGGAGPTARTLPRVALALLAAALLLRLVVGLFGTDRPVGSIRDWSPVFLVVIATVAALALMPLAGFIPCAAGLGIIIALAYGERKPVFSIGLPVLAALAIGLGAEHVLNIPLP